MRHTDTIRNVGVAIATLAEGLTKGLSASLDLAHQELDAIDRRVVALMKFLSDTADLLEALEAHADLDALSPDLTARVSTLYTRIKRALEEAT